MSPGRELASFSKCGSFFSCNYLGHPSLKHQDWFNENDEEIKRLFEDKHRPEKETDRKCAQCKSPSHSTRECTNDIVCHFCNGEGHKKNRNAKTLLKQRSVNFLGSMLMRFSKVERGIG